MGAARVSTWAHRQAGFRSVARAELQLCSWHMVECAGAACALAQAEARLHCWHALTHTRCTPFFTVWKKRTAGEGGRGWDDLRLRRPGGAPHATLLRPQLPSRLPMHPARNPSCAHCLLLTVLAQHVDGDGGVPGIRVLVVAGGDGEHAVAALRHGDGQPTHHITQAAGLAARGEGGSGRARVRRWVWVWVWVVLWRGAGAGRCP